MTGKVAVVFGGGGVKAAAHVGAHRALAEAGILASHYLGTSMGAVIAAMYATGLSQDEIERMLATVNRRDVARLRPLLALRGLTAPSLFRLEPLRETFERLVPARAFGELRTPLTVTAVDLQTGALVLLGDAIPVPQSVGHRPAGVGIEWTSLGPEVPLIDALLATCALPFFYPPILIQGRRYVDGGFRMVVPWEPAAALGPDLVFSVDTGAGFDEMGGEDDSAMPALARAHDASIGILMAANTALQFPRWEAGGPRLVHVRPRVRRGSTFRVEEGEWYREEGYRAAREALAAEQSGAERGE